MKQDGVELLFSYLLINIYLTNSLETKEFIFHNEEIQIEFESKLRAYYNQTFNISPTKFHK